MAGHRDAGLALITDPYPYRNVTPPLALHSHGSLTPSGGTRTSIAFRQDTPDRIVTRIESELANHIRSSMMRDPVSGLWLPSIQLEPPRTNICLRSEDLTVHGVWSHLRCDHTDTTNSTLPTGAATDNDCVHEDATAASNHFFTQANLTTDAGTWCWSFFSEMINRRWMAFRFNLTLNQIIWGDLQDLAIGANYIGTTARGVKDWGDGLGRFWFSFTGEAAAKSAFLYVADREGQPAEGFPRNFDGLDQDSFFFEFAQLEKGEYPSSYIKTEAASVQRTADAPVVYTLGPVLGGREATLLVPYISPVPYTPAADVDLFSIYKNGAAGTDHLTGHLEGGTGKLKVTSAANGGAAGEVVVNKVISDERFHWLAVSARNGQLHAWVDNSGNHEADADATMAPDLDRFDLKPHGGWSGGVHMWPQFSRMIPRPVRPVGLRA